MNWSILSGLNERSILRLIYNLLDVDVLRYKPDINTYNETVYIKKLEFYIHFIALPEVAGVGNTVDTLIYLYRWTLLKT